jgi:hypothetical protein
VHVHVIVHMQIKEKFPELVTAGVKVGAKEVREAQAVSVPLLPLALPTRSRFLVITREIAEWCNLFMRRL